MSSPEALAMLRIARRDLKAALALQQASIDEASWGFQLQQVVEKAIKGMLPKNRLGRELFRNLYVYAGPDHQQQAQQPKPIKLTSIK